MLNLLVVAHPGDHGSWQRAADELAADLARWSGNHVHTLVAAPDDVTRSDPGELHTAPWRLAAGTPPGALPLTDATAPEAGAQRPPSLRP